MPPPLLTRRQAREFDRLAVERYGIPGLLLMENAGRGIADKLVELKVVGPVVICCGKGNNGGDGLAIARQLDCRGLEVRIVLFAGGSQLQGDAAANLEIVRRSGLPLHEVLDPDAARRELERQLSGADCTVDALLGTGARDAPAPLLAGAIRQMNAARAVRVAVDIPSGLDCDSGAASPGTFRAHHTCTLVAPRPGLILPAAREYVGQLHVIHLGTPARLLQEAQAAGAA